MVNPKQIHLIERHVQDPPRTPKVIVPIENQAKQIYIEHSRKIVTDITVKMTEMIKKK
jgi:hypothetical protein